MTKIIELQPVKETISEFEILESRIKAAFRAALYEPLLKELSPKKAVKLYNARSGSTRLIEAIRSGDITYQKGVFLGKLSAGVTKDLKDLGARWNKRLSRFELLPSEIPPSVQTAISDAASKFYTRMAAVDAAIAGVDPAKIAGSIKAAEVLDLSIYKTDRNVSLSMKAKGLTLAPELPPAERKKIASEWELNLDRYITDFAVEETAKLRRDVQAAVLAGSRRDTIAKIIQDSYGVTSRKAKFLARQETGLMMAKLRETRYAAAGITEYKWACVVGSPNHPVRPAHKKLEGKIFSWNNPPITTSPDEPERRNNPGEDYNCRCFAKPIVRIGDKKAAT